MLAAISNAAGGDLGRVGRNLIAASATSAERQQLRTFLLQVPSPLPGASTAFLGCLCNPIVQQRARLICWSNVSGMACKIL